MPSVERHCRSFMNVFMRRIWAALPDLSLWLHIKDLISTSRPFYNELLELLFHKESTLHPFVDMELFSIFLNKRKSLHAVDWSDM